PGHSEAARAWREALGIPGSAKVLLSMRALTRRYGHHHILEAFHRARPWIASDCFLVFKEFNPSQSPEVRAYKQELQECATQYGIAHRVRWVPEIPYDRLPGLYATADAIVNFPCMDAFPVTFLEAAACERPVISCHLPSYQGTFADEYFH